MAFHGPILYLYLGRRCNNYCQFCVVDGRLDPEMSPAAVASELTVARQRGIVDVVFSGGDPTTRSDILAIVKKAKDLGYLSIQIQTNGRKLSDKQFAHALIDAGATEFSISLHGHTPTLQDMISGVTGSFAQTVEGILNIYEVQEDAIVITNSVITRSNLKHLPRLMDLLSELKVNAIQLAFIHAQGRADQLFEEITPSKTGAMPHIHASLDRAILHGYGVGRMMVEAYPYCFLRGYEAFCSDLYIPSTLVRSDAGQIEMFPLRKARAKSRKCSACTFSVICHGPWREYPERRGWDEFNPITDCSPEDVIPLEFLRQHYERSNEQL